ncbi:MAG: hypothetical protein HFE47_06320 [Clostridia bacterium]|nr:hypothetical protein [Clostridia bacterium]
MRKKIISIFISVLLCCTVLCGCALIEHNYEKDAKQVIVVIDSIEDTDNGVTFKSEPRYIYKSDLTSVVQQNAQTYMSNYGYTLQKAVEVLLDQLVMRELLSVEADRLRAQGFIDWTQKDDNDKLKSIYSAIDSRLTSIRSEIASGFGEDDSMETEEVSTETTYPTPEQEKNDEDTSYYQYDEFGEVIMVDKVVNGQIVYEQKTDSFGNLVFDEEGKPVYDQTRPVKVPDYKVWEPEEADYPAIWGTEDEKSLDREAMYRFINNIKDLANEDFKATAEDKALFAQDEKDIENVINTKGIEAVYPMIGKTHYLEYLVGTSAEQSIMITKLQDYITDSVDVTDDEVVKQYRNQLEYQVNTYGADQAAYQKAVADGTTTMLYLRDDSYFYVKHILLPFSDEQKAYLESYKKDPQNADKDYKVMRDSQMVNETVVYPHKNGEDDKTNPKTVQNVFNEVYAAMSRVQSNPKEAERLFDDYIYKYNTDPGAFGYGKMYAVKRNDDEEHSGYMEEFYDAAIELYDGYNEGAVLPQYAVTDYGVHIMYLALKVKPGTRRNLDDYLTLGQYKTVRETLEETIRSTKEGSAFDAWAADRITYYQDNEKVVHTYPKRYKDIYES